MDLVPDVRPGDARIVDDLYESAWLCGGPGRVALVALVALSRDGRITISSERHRVDAVRRKPGDPVERAALGAIPHTGLLLGPALQRPAVSTWPRTPTTPPAASEPSRPSGATAGGLGPRASGSERLSRRRGGRARTRPPDRAGSRCGRRCGSRCRRCRGSC
ncbi:TIGR04222 domain-containing membrane protein [Spirillospora sp. NBC_01491]|uniref:TIGR04222 domain-containing membrane protein n=1 Tax=Spirillospora sp. NBC_01491 TaxID=2976007 RepID=UPI003FA6C374